MSSSWDCTSKSSKVWKQTHRCYTDCYWIISVDVTYPYLLPYPLDKKAHQDFIVQNQEKILPSHLKHKFTHTQKNCNAV